MFVVVSLFEVLLFLPGRKGPGDGGLYQNKRARE